MHNDATVLYVEDNYENRVLIRRILQAEGYQVLEAETASEALSTVQNQTPDLILVDINLPEIDGYSLTAQLKNLSYCYVIIMKAVMAHNLNTKFEFRNPKQIQNSNVQNSKQKIEIKSQLLPAKAGSL